MCWNCNNKISAHYAQFIWHNNIGKQNFSLGHVRKLRLNIKNKKFSHLVFKMSSCSSHTSPKSLAPLSNSPVDFGLMQFIPFIHNSLSEVIEVFDLCFLNSHLKYSPDLVVHLVQIWTIWWPQIWWDEVWSQNFQEFDSLTSPMRRGSILLERNVIRILLNVRKEIFHEQIVPIVLAIHLSNLVDKVKACSPKSRYTNWYHYRLADCWKRHCCLFWC